MTIKCRNHNECWNCELETCVRKYPPWDLSAAGEKSRSPQSKEQRNRYQKRKRDICIAFGVCTVCKKRDAYAGGHVCKTCKEKAALKHRNKLEGVVRYERTSSGLCYFCGEPALPGKKTCQKHYDIRCKSIEKARASSEKSREEASKRRKELYLEDNNGR